jgi:hypothetical protein
MYTNHQEENPISQQNSCMTIKIYDLANKIKLVQNWNEVLQYQNGIVLV